MEQWIGFEYGPLRIEDVEGNTVRCMDINLYILNKTEFTVLLRLMTCYGRAVSRELLLCGLSSEHHLRVAICRLRQFLESHFGNSLSIDGRRSFGYKLSLRSSDFIPNEDLARVR